MTTAHRVGMVAAVPRLKGLADRSAPRERPQSSGNLDPALAHRVHDGLAPVVDGELAERYQVSSAPLRLQTRPGVTLARPT